MSLSSLSSVRHNGIGWEKTLVTQIQTNKRLVIIIIFLVGCTLGYLVSRVQSHFVMESHELKITELSEDRARLQSSLKQVDGRASQLQTLLELVRVTSQRSTSNDSYIRFLLESIGESVTEKDSAAMQAFRQEVLSILKETDETKFRQRSARLLSALPPMNVLTPTRGPG
jgi:hypothetical protein